MKVSFFACVIFSFLCIASLFGQNVPVSANGIATGDGGSVNFTIGQVTYGKATGTTGSLSGGMQQPYQIDEITGVEDAGISLNFRIYPNPTPDYIILEVEEPRQLEYSLYDSNGRIILRNKVVDRTTMIPMSGLNSATYFLKVFMAKNEVKSFRIIKN